MALVDVIKMELKGRRVQEIIVKIFIGLVIQIVIFFGGVKFQQLSSD